MTKRGGRARAGGYLALLGAMAVTLAACAGPQPVRTVKGGAAGPAAVAPSDAAPVSAPVDAPTPEEIAGAAPAKVRALLGAPDLTRREPPAEVWQYGAGSCVVDVVFYPPDGTEADVAGLRVALLESRDMDGAALAPSACLGRLAAAQARLDP